MRFARRPTGLASPTTSAGITPPTLGGLSTRFRACWGCGFGSGRTNRPRLASGARAWLECWTAASLALKSKDRSTKVGCVLFTPESWSQLSGGYNGFPRSVDDAVEARHKRPSKYSWSVHAERNAIDNAARNGTRLEGAIAICTAMPCSQCMGSLINAGCSHIITLQPSPEFEERWGESMAIGGEMSREAGVPVTLLQKADFELVGIPEFQLPLLRFLFPD